MDNADVAAALTARFESEGRAMDRFTISPVPADAPRLLGVMREFDHLFDVWAVDMPNVWGQLMIQDWQPGVRRVEIYMEWDRPQIDEQGEIIRDAEGNIQVVLDADGNPERENSGKAIYINAESGYFGGGH